MPLAVHAHLHQARLKCISQSMNQGNLDNLDVDAAIAEIASGTIAKTIAQKYGVTAQAVRAKLRRAKPEEYKQAVCDQVEHWVYDSAEEMENLPADAICIARARARADFRLKVAAALNPAFSPKQEVMHTASGPLISITLAGQPQIAVDNSIDAKHQRIESD